MHTPCSPQPLPPCPFRFPDPRDFGPDGLVAAGGDFRPEAIIAAYRAGIFPWPHPSEEYLWFSPDPRAIIPLNGPHISRRLERTIRQGRFRVTLDAAFADVITACGIRDESTWITPALRRAYLRLHQLGWAHSFEVWSPEGILTGGLYGVGVGALFGAESMFHRATDASKIAMVAMMDYARRIGLQLVDIQVLTPHTASMGAVEVPRATYLARLREVLAHQVDWRTM